MGGSINGSSSNMYVPIQHPNPNPNPSYTSSAILQPEDYENATPPWERQPSPPFTLQELEEAENFITRLSNK